MLRVIRNRRSRSGRALEEALQGVEEEGQINWTGAPLEDSLNGEAFTNKLRQLTRLGVAGVPAVLFSLRKEGEDWLPRKNHHQQGFDLTNHRLREGRIPADFYVKKETFTDEYRIHVFRTPRDNMRVVRVARKVPNGLHPHPWIRCHRLGWKLSYVGGATESAKEVARNSLRALHLDFGAVDVGIRPDASPCVLEVNTCPGLDSGTLQYYVDNIIERFS